MHVLIVFMGAGIGGVFRHGVNVIALRLIGPNAFPFGTLAINVVGSGLMGITIGLLAARLPVGTGLRLFLTTGILGGFTTFSAFSLETVLLWERGEAGAAALYALGSVVLSLGALAAGLSLVRALAGPG